MKHAMFDNQTTRTPGFLAGLGLAVSAAVAQDYGFDWVTKQPDLAIGGAAHEYRIMQTSATATDHLEFVQSVWQHIPRNERLLAGFTGLWLLSATGNKDDPQYYIRNGKDRVATQMNFRTAAMFANWPHNGKADGAWAITDGAYDTSTFGKDADGFLTDQERHHPDARVWLPTMDEMARAMYWDPAKDGREGGYRLYQHSKNEVPISGLPDEGDLQANNDILDIEAFQLPPFFNPQFWYGNELFLYEVEWTPDEYTARAVRVTDANHLNNSFYIDSIGRSVEFTQQHSEGGNGLYRARTGDGRHLLCCFGLVPKALILRRYLGRMMFRTSLGLSI